MLGVIGIVVALVVLVALTFKGWHMGVVAIASSLIIILTSQMDIWTTITENFAPSFTSFAGNWFLVFSLAAIFGKVMDLGVVVRVGVDVHCETYSKAARQKTDCFNRTCSILDPVLRRNRSIRYCIYDVSDLSGTV